MSELLIPNVIGGPRIPRPLNENFDEIQAWANGNIDSSNIRLAGINGDRISDTSLTGGKLYEKTVTGDKIADNTIRFDSLGPMRVDTWARGSSAVNLYATAGTVESPTYSHSPDLPTLEGHTPTRDGFLVLSGFVTVSHPSSSGPRVWAAIVDKEQASSGHTGFIYRLGQATVPTVANGEVIIPVSGVIPFNKNVEWKYRLAVGTDTFTSSLRVLMGGRTNVYSQFIPR